MSRAEDRSRLMVFGVITVALGFLALAALTYLAHPPVRYAQIPKPPETLWFVRHFSALVSEPSHAAFYATFRMLILLVWLGYAAIISSVRRFGVPQLRLALTIAGFIAVAMAVVFPPVLSRDPFAYLGFARMPVLYHLNPYTSTLRQLAALHDPAARAFSVPHSSVYGPLWTLLTAALAAIMNGAPLWAQMIALRLIEAFALIFGALGAREVARQWNPRHADLAAVAFAFNPLLIIEGPGSGHNDLLMVALLLWGIALVLRGSWQWGYLLVGMSAAVKFVSLAVVPWLIWEQVREREIVPALKVAFASGVLAVAPMLVGFAPFWKGHDLLQGVLTMYGGRAAHHGEVHYGTWFVLALYAVFTVWVVLGKQSRLAPAWSLWSLAAVTFAIPGVLPWYFIWPISLTVTKWDLKQKLVTAACFFVALQWMLNYTATRVFP